MKLNPEKCVFGVEARKIFGFPTHRAGDRGKPRKVCDILAMRSPASIKEVQQLTGRMPCPDLYPLEETRATLISIV